VRSIRKKAKIKFLINTHWAKYVKKCKKYHARKKILKLKKKLKLRRLKKIEIRGVANYGKNIRKKLRKKNKFRAKNRYKKSKNATRHVMPKNDRQ